MLLQVLINFVIIYLQTGGGLVNGYQGKHKREGHVPGQLYEADMRRTTRIYLTSPSTNEGRS